MGEQSVFESIPKAKLLIRTIGHGLILFLLATSFAIGQTPKPTTKSAEAESLETKQRQLVQRFQKLEELFLRMSELEAVSNPTHAGLLMQAAQLSKQLGTRQRLNNAGDLIARGQISKAIQEQESAHENLKKLLELLQSENRASRIRDERAKLEDILKDLRRLESLQRALRGRTEAGQDIQQSANDQKDLTQQLGAVEDNLKDPKADKEKSDSPTPEKQNTQSLDKPSDNKPTSDSKPTSESKAQELGDSQSKPSVEPSSNPKETPKDSKPAKDPATEPANPSQDRDKPGQRENQDLKAQPGSKSDSPEGDRQQRNQPAQPNQDSSESKKSGEESSDSSSQSSENKPSSKPESKEERARKRVEKARDRMKNAEERLQQDQRREAVEEQEAAEKELRDAVDELEKILRQLREEEIERSLVDLETRLRKMNEMQKQVRDQTGKLFELTGDARDRNLEIQANKLSIEQNKIVLEGQRALLLLQDEGSSTAFPEAMQQIVKDSQLVAKRLAQADVTESTQSIEDEILAALEELLDSLKQEQKKRDDKKKQQQQQSQQQQEPGDQPLVDSLAELKLLKTLQLRVNRRTQSLAKQAENTDDSVGQVRRPELKAELDDLADRQQKIYEITRDIILKASQN